MSKKLKAILPREELHPRQKIDEEKHAAYVQGWNDGYREGITKFGEELSKRTQRKLYKP